MKRREITGVLFIVITLCIYFISQKLQEGKTKSNQPKVKLQAETIDSLSTETPEPTVLYGIIVDSMEVVETKVKPNQNLSGILTAYNVSINTITELAEKSRQIFNVRKIAANRKITILCDKDSSKTARFLIYEPNALEYVVYSLKDTIGATVQQREIEVKEKSIYGIISSSVSESISNAGGSPALTNLLVNVYAWQIDFFRIQKGDRFKVIYEEKLVDGTPVGVGRILAAEFTHSNHTYNAFYFDQGDGTDYFDEQGNSLRKAFLKAPLDYSRISSRFTLNRFHPVQKRWKAHLGTDYAAPTGTEIRTVGDGVVLEARYHGGNGNYVKVRHNGTYTTQYLHMSKIAKGIKPGTRVRQGQVIGYVGSTGLATGPHLCYRFWKNGKQVDPFREEVPPSEPIANKNVEAFNQIKERYTEKLASIDASQPLELQASL